MTPEPLFRRYGDKPHQMSEKALIELDNGTYLCEPKIDGWRGQVHQIDSTLVVFSGGFLLLPITPGILDGFPKLGHGTVWDVEWTSRRACKMESMNIFGIMYLDSKWQGELTHEVRRQFLIDNIPESFLVPSWDSDFLDHYEEMKKTPDIYEGVVLKHRNSKLKGGPSGIKKNGLWVKVKFRE